MLEKEDYAEPVCPFDNSMWLNKAQTAGCEKRLPLKKILDRYDILLVSGKKAEALDLLENSLAEAKDHGDKSSQMSLLSELVGFYRQTGNKERGLEVISEIASSFSSLGLEHTLSGGTILLNCATALHSFGETDKSISFFSEASRCYSQNLAPDDIRFTALYNNFAAAYESKGEYDMAEKLYRAALMILTDNGELMDRAVTHLNIARLFIESGKSFEEASEELSSAGACLDSPDAVWDSYYAHTCRKCEGMFRAFGITEYADELLERADEIMNSGE